MKLFENEFLDSLTKVHPAVPAGFWLPVVTAMLYSSFVHYPVSAGKMILLIVLGIFAWTLIEYVMHRFLFHMVSSNELLKRFIFLVHENHHITPNDRLRGMMPIAPALIYGSIIFWGIATLTSVSVAIPIMSGIILGYLAYDYLHFSFHHNQFNNRLWKFLRVYHLRHHGTPGVYYGVSSPLWDYIFRSHKK